MTIASRLFPLRIFLLLAATLSMALSLSAHAQGQGMSPQLHLQAEEINQLMQDGNNQQAIERLAALRGRSNLNNYEKAVLTQMLGYAYIGVSKYADAAKAFEETLAFDVLPVEATASITTALIQMHMETKEYDKARQRIEQVLAGDTPADPDFLAVAAYVYFELKQYGQAEKHLLQAISSVTEPKENWYQILLAVYRAQSAWPKAEAVLREVLSRFPDNGTYWQYMSYVLFEQDKEHEALASLMLAYRLNLIKSEELERISGMYANIGVPEKAARLLDEWMRKGELETTTERLSLTGRLWLVARERSKAITVLVRAAEQMTEGEIDLMLGKLYYEDENWEPAVQHFQAALSKGKLKGSPAEAQLLLGICAYHAERTDTAITALEAARQDKQYGNHARYWLTRIKEAG